MMSSFSHLLHPLERQRVRCGKGGSETDMSTTRDLDLPGRLVAGAVGVVLVVYVGRQLVSRLRRSGRPSERRASKAESALRALVRQIGAQLMERGVSDEDDLDATIAEAKRKAYERRYTSTSHPSD